MAKTILIVEDDEDSMEVTATVLQKAGYGIICATTGEEGLSSYEGNKPDLVLLDIRLPKVNGYDVFFKIKEKHSDAKVIFMTAFAVDNETYQKAKKLGLIYLLMKPFSFPFLKELVASALKGDTKNGKIIGSLGSVGFSSNGN